MLNKRSHAHPIALTIICMSHMGVSHFWVSKCSGMGMENSFVHFSLTLAYIFASWELSDFATKCFCLPPTDQSGCLIQCSYMYSKN